MLDCQATREALEEHRRGELPADAVRPIEAHLSQCEQCRALRDEADRLAALVRGLPRTPAPPGLARRVAALGRSPGRARGWLGRPWTVAAATAAVVALALSPWLQFRPRPEDDPVERFLQAALAEHTRILLQLQAATADVPDPDTALATVRSLTDIQIPPAFAGNDELTLIAARPTVIANRKAAAVVLRDRAWFITTYFAASGTDLAMPSRGRVQIEQYKPFMRQANGFSVIYWKQGEYAYVMVSDLDDPRSRQLFLKMRKSL